MRGKMKFAMKGKKAPAFGMPVVGKMKKGGMSDKSGRAMKRNASDARGRAMKKGK